MLAMIISSIQAEMSAAKSNWAEDYSYLMHSIEGRLASQIPETEEKKSSESMRRGLNDLSSIDGNSSIMTARKRLRLSDQSIFKDSLLKEHDNHYDIGEDDRRSQSQPVISRSYVLQLENSIEEVKLENEELKDKLNNAQFELKHSSEKYLRQMTFIESEVIRLQKALEDKNEKYYDEKKKWQSKVRGLEAEIDKLQESFSEVKSTVAKKASSADSSSDAADWKAKFLAQENTHTQEKAGLVKKVHELEAKVSTLSTSLNLQHKLEEENASLVKLQAELERNVIELRRHLLSSENKVNELERELSSMQLQVQAAEGKQMIAQHQGRLFEGEVKSLRALLESYEAEFKIGRPDANKMNKLHEEVVAKLRKDMDAVRAEANTIASKAMTGASATASTNASSAISAETADKISFLEAEVQKWKDLYEGLQAYSRTDVLPSYTRVLHMESNPYSLALQQRGIEPLTTESSVPIDELKRLRRQVKQQQPDALNSTQVPTKSQREEIGIFNTSPEGVHQPASTNAGGPDSNKLNQRLKEMFKERITSFREAVYLLTGYKVDLYTAEDDAKAGQECKRLRLRSMYAESPDDSLIFQWRGETLELLETPFASKIDPKLFSYLNRSNSVPAFLSNVTIELFENQTFM
jgi:mitotic spindle assembly checkpoint protein MAD1